LPPPNVVTCSARLPHPTSIDWELPDGRPDSGKAVISDPEFSDT